MITDARMLPVELQSERPQSPNSPNRCNSMECVLMLICNCQSMRKVLQTCRSGCNRPMGHEKKCQYATDAGAPKVKTAALEAHGGTTRQVKVGTPISNHASLHRHYAIHICIASRGLALACMPRRILWSLQKRSRLRKNDNARNACSDSLCAKVVSQCSP